MSGVPDVCPYCGADMTGPPIPEEHRDYYTDTHFSRVMGHKWSHIYDGVCAWSCPDCGGWWHRFPEGDPRRARVERVMKPRNP